MLTVPARIMRLLVGMGIFKEVGYGTFASTPLSHLYVSASPLTQGIIHMCVNHKMTNLSSRTDTCSKTSQNENISALPSYFQKNGYMNSGDGYNGPFQHARLTNLHAFDWLATQPRLQHPFNVVMSFPLQLMEVTGLNSSPCRQNYK